MKKQKMRIGDKELTVEYVAASLLRPAKYNPRRWDESAAKQLQESIKRFGMVDPLIVNSAAKRKNIIIGGHFRWEVAKKMKVKELLQFISLAPYFYLN